MHLGSVIGKFKLEKRLGHGAMGDVFLGVHVELGSFVAIKILNAAGCAEPNGVARFLSEAKAVAAIDHEQIARVIDQDRLPDGTPYIVMEFVEGVTLRELLDDRGALGLRLTLELMLDVLSALSVAHVRGIVHRDLKPENIRVTKSGRAKILDFGIAKVLHDVPTPLTQQGMLVGTPYYMSPEQIGGGEIDGRSDLYALGVILFECVTGKRPFEASTVMALLGRHLNEPPPSVRGLRPEVPVALEVAIFRALEKPAAQRFSTADELASALRGVLADLPADGPVVSRVRDPRAVATPSLSVPQGTTEDAFGNTVRSPMTRRFRIPIPIALIVLVVVAGVIATVSLSPMGRGSGRGQAPLAERALVIDPQPQALSPTLPPAGGGSQEPEVVVQPPPPPPPKLIKKPVATTPPPVAVALAPTPAPPPTKPASGVTLIETGSDRTSRPVDFDPRAFDPLGYLAKAQALARARMPDALLTNFNVSGLFSGDRVDLTASKNFEAEYYFRSPAKSVADPRLRDDDQDIPCLTYVIVSAKKVEVFTAESLRGCREKPLPPLKCSIADAFRQARANGLQDASKSMNLAWLHDGWYFDFGDDGSLSVTCP